MDLEDLKKLDSSIIFYAVASFFAVVTLAYFSIEYIDYLSPFTVSAILFGFFAVSLLIGIAKEFTPTEITAYLVSGGSYLVFYVYTTARFAETSNHVLASLIASTLIFGGLGYLLTSGKQWLPAPGQAYRAIAVIAGVLAVLIAYNLTAVSYQFQVDLEEEVEASEEVEVGEASIDKRGYLPIDVNREVVRLCFEESETDSLGPGAGSLGTERVGGYMTGFSPEFEAHRLSFSISDRQFNETDLERGEVYPVEKVDDCSDVEEGVLGVEASQGYRYPY